LKSLIKFSLLYAGAAVLLRLIGFVISLWLAKSLSPAQYAYWGLLYSAQTGFISFALVGNKILIGYWGRFALIWF